MWYYIVWKKKIVPTRGLGEVKRGDGSMANNQLRAGGGVVLRDSNGQWLKGFGRFFSATNSLKVEAWALRDSHSLARDLGITYLLIKLDAKVLLELVWRTTEVIMELQENLPRLPRNTSMSHILRS